MARFLRLGEARSLAEFARIAGLSSNDTAYVSETANSRDLEMAAGLWPDSFLRNEGRGKGWIKETSQEKLAQIALAQAAAMSGGGNKPTIKVEKGETVKLQFSSYIPRYVIIDGEVRGEWWREGSRYELRDSTGFALQHNHQWRKTFSGELEKVVSARPSWVWLRSWDDALAVANATECWEAGLLPSIGEQKAAKAQRDAARKAEEDTRFMLDRIRPHMAELVRYLERQDDTQAAFFVSVLKGDDA